MPGPGPGSSTSLRRPRSSVGPADTPLFDSLPQPPVDLEFRRKHSRQNKEIIGENVQHKNSIKLLRDEITSLKEELMEVKHANRILSGQLKALGPGHRSANLTAGLQAIDMLLEALPALSLLRNDLMAPTDGPAPIPYEVTRANLLRNMGMSIATRPAASGSRARGLETLGEEDEMEATVFDQIEDGRKDLRAPTASPFAKASSRSPAPNRLRNASLPTFILNSPLSSPLSSASASASPSPRKRIVPSPKRKARRRRESGIMLPPPPATRVNRESEVTTNDDQELVVYDDPRPVHEPESEAATQSGSHNVERPVTVSDSDSRLGESTSTGSSDTYDMLSQSTSNTSAMDESARGRRARSSVNYKEPSLAKKMRKPDGVAVSEILAHQRLLSNELPPSEMSLPRPGMRRKSVLPKSFGKATNHSHDSISDDDDDDADEIEDSLFATGSRHTSPQIGPSDDNSSLLSDPPSTSSRSTISELEVVDEVEAVERIPTPIPPMKAKATPTPTKSTVIAPVDSPPRPHSRPAPAPASSVSKPLSTITATRTSPRKAQSQSQPLSKSQLKTQPKAQAPSSLSARPESRRPSTLKARPSRVITPSSRVRDALASVPEPNVPPKTTAAVSKRV